MSFSLCQSCYPQKSNVQFSKVELLAKLCSFYKAMKHSNRMYGLGVVAMNPVRKHQVINIIVKQLFSCPHPLYLAASGNMATTASSYNSSNSLEIFFWDELKIMYILIAHGQQSGRPSSTTTSPASKPPVIRTYSVTSFCSRPALASACPDSDFSKIQQLQK